MRVDKYTVLVEPGVERETGHVALPHNTQYTIKLLSHDRRRCDAAVEIDGKPVGVFRLDGFGNAVLERSPADHGRFTFYSAGTAAAGQAGEGGVAAADKGLVRVVFTPEKRVDRPTYQPASFGWVLRSADGYTQTSGFAAKNIKDDGHSSWSGGAGMQSAAVDDFAVGAAVGGVTGLSGMSGQKFAEVGAIDLDHAQAVTITIRLVTLPDGPRPLPPNPGPVRANPVPPPVG